MSEQVRIEAPDASRATALLTRLARFDARLIVRDDGGCDVTVQSTLAGAELNRLVDRVIDAVEAWLAETRLEETTVHVGGQRYSMRPSPGVERSTQPI
jgi:hypothetical protein